MDSRQFKDAAKASIDHSKSTFPDHAVIDAWPRHTRPPDSLTRTTVVDYYENITDHSVVSQVEPGYLRKVLPDSPPREGESWDVIRRDIDSKIVPGLTHWQSPNFFAFFPCPASYPSLLGELYSAAFTGACFNWICSPAVTELETIVLDWVAQILGLPQIYHSTGPTRGGGVIQGSASEAVLTMMVAAREKYLRDTLPAPGSVTEEELEDLDMRKRSRLVALGSAAAHSSTKKAARILGVRYADVPTSSASNFAMTGEALREKLEELRAKGLEPFFMTATLGTTDTCAVDDFGAIADVLAKFSGSTTNGTVTNGESNGTAAAPAARKGEVWVHIDAAYAGSALVTPEAQESVGVQHLAHFHSFNFNMHKWLLTNFDASCVFVANRAWLEEALGSELHVYRNTYSDGGLVTDYRNWQIPLGRRFRSLKVWFVLRSYGVAGLQKYIRRGVSQGELFAGWLRARADLFEIITGPAFALTVFRLAPPGMESEEKKSELTRALYEEVNRSGKLWVTSTVLEGKFAIRVMTGNITTEEEHVKAAYELILATAERVVKGA